MIADVIKLALTNIPTITFVAALIAAYVTRRPDNGPERYLAWILLLAVGVDGVWAGIFHIFLPTVASGEIGWAASPFEFEIGIADLALGIAAVIAFRKSLSFQSGVATYAILFYVGVALGHFYQAFAHNDYSPDNFGLLLVVTVLRAILLGWLLRATWRNRKTV
jgi:hypothetical protein